MNILHITHDDLDAVGGELAVRTKFEGNNIKTVWCNYRGANPVDDVVDDVIKNKCVFEGVKYDKIIVSDISMNENNAERLDALRESADIELSMFDHHQPAVQRFVKDGQTKYPWMTIDKTKCGALITAEMLGVTEIMSEETFKIIDAYDRFLTDEKHAELFEKGKIMNYLLYTQHHKKGRLDLAGAAKAFLERIKTGEDIVSQEEMEAGAVACNGEIKKRADKLRKAVREKDQFLAVDGVNFLVYHKEGRTDEMLMNYISEDIYTDPEFYPAVVIFANKDKNNIKLSVRTLGAGRKMGDNTVPDTSVNVSDLLSQLGWGGGHPSAAGGHIPAGDLKKDPVAAVLKTIEDNREEVSKALTNAIVGHVTTVRDISKTEEVLVK